MSNAFSASARTYRAAIGKQDFPEPAQRILEKILFFSLDHGRYQALIPTQALLGLLCRLRKGKVSETLSWLEECRVVMRTIVGVSYGGRRRRWTLYTIEPPDQWRLVDEQGRVMPARVEESPLVKDAELWLAQLDVEQRELIPPPASLDDLLREDFVDRSGRQVAVPLTETGHGVAVLPSAVSRVEGAESRAIGADRTGSTGENLGGVESKSKSVSHASMVPREGTKVETEAFGAAAKVPPEGTSPVVAGSLGGNVPCGGTKEFPAGELSSSPGENLAGGRGDSNRTIRIDKAEASISNRIDRIDSIARAREEVPPQGTPGRPVRKAALDEFLLDPYVREKLSRCGGLSIELVNSVNLDGNYSQLKKQFGELYNSDPDEAKELLAVAVTKNVPNRWLNTSVRVALGLQERPMK